MKRPRFSFFFTTIFLMHIVEAISAIFCLHTLNIKTEIGKVKGWKIYSNINLGKDWGSILISAKVEFRIILPGCSGVF